ncbi:MAG: outer membrane protein assembly factor BamD [Halieaceae bacterium]|nr:outer membrane protein assembly factor BamD [Halieaceae bacterium]MBT5007871.1 outer membrane protein assembly factor BamD [Halieaceae bacterium]MBT6123766.1 outer membrane protein assembly factor BamD [Halieaceae bacterium]MBT7717819.1 outer membrane protein assembly factor BamD [Halieaceae bacterium]
MKYALVFLLSLIIIGCSGNDELPDIAADTGEQQIYEEAQRYLRNKNWNLAVRSLQVLESRYPFGKYAEQSQLEIIYAHYNGYEHDAAVEAAERFIRLHPAHPNVDYAYYMKGLAAFAGNDDIFSRFLPTDESERDVSQAKEAFAEFNQLVSRFPDSPYAPDARARMVHLRNLLARHEILVANYYFRRGAYMAATNRGRYVVENFQRTPAVADGLAVMAQGYILLGLEDLAKDTIGILAMNYPEHPNLDKNGEFKSVYTLDGLQRNWINKASFGLFFPPTPPQFDSRPKL